MKLSEIIKELERELAERERVAQALTTYAGNRMNEHHEIERLKSLIAKLNAVKEL